MVPKNRCHVWSEWLSQRWAPSRENTSAMSSLTLPLLRTAELLGANHMWFQSDTFPKKDTLLMFVVWLPMGSIRRRETGLGRANLIMEWKSTHQAASYVERSLQNPSRPDFSIHPNPSEESKTTKNHPRYAKIITFITKKKHIFYHSKTTKKMVTPHSPGNSSREDGGQRWYYHRGHGIEEMYVLWLSWCNSDYRIDLSIPIGSMYGIYANIWGILMVNVTIYSIHGSYGIYNYMISTIHHHSLVSLFLSFFYWCFMLEKMHLNMFMSNLIYDLFRTYLNVFFSNAASDWGRVRSLPGRCGWTLGRQIGGQMGVFYVFFFEWESHGIWM